MNEVISLTKVGWNYEGVNSQQPATGNAVYRLYNPNSGEHFYTLSSYERDSLVKAGWRYEQISFYSDPAKHTAIYRLFNPKFILRVVQNETRLSKLGGDTNKLVGMDYKKH